MLAVLIDPDKYNAALVELCNSQHVHCILVGGSRIEKGDIRKTIIDIKKKSDLPVILFPGDESQLCDKADGLLLLSLLSGRNAEYLIEKHVRAAPLIRKMKLKHIPVAYLLVGEKNNSATQKITFTSPMNVADKSLITHTCMAAEQLGFKAIYLEAGSGARSEIKPSLVKKIKASVKIPIIVGGGINSAAKAKSLIENGANMVVVGNALEKNVSLLTEISACFAP
jgi:putative glycerol-1-phosphate prenyltransferase